MRPLALLILFLSLSASILAQETVFNVPSGDVLDRGKIYGEFDFTYRPTDALRAFTPRLVVGLGKQVEIGLNVNGVMTPLASQTTITPTIKWKAYDGGNNGWSFLVGDNLFIPVQNKTYDTGTWVYAELVKSWNTNTRATLGAYYATPNVFTSFQRAGGQFAIEQTLTKRVTLAADCFTGNSSVGYVTPGLIVKLTPKVTWYISYQFGNPGMAPTNHQVLTEIGWN
jgi:hypothetical protein